MAKIQDLRQEMDWINRLWGRLSDEPAKTAASETGFEIESIEPMLLLSGSIGDAGDFVGDDAFVTDFCDIADFSIDGLVEAGQGDELLTGFGDGPDLDAEY